MRGADPEKYGITAPLIISDEDVGKFLRNAIETRTRFDVWCADKEKVRKVLAEGLPQELRDLVVIDIEDTYQTEYASFMARRSLRLQTRFIITGAVGLLCLVMLYVIQRFRVRDRMGMIAVYRMLGIPGRDLVGLFILENLLLTLRFAVPTVLLAWAAAELLPLLGVGALSVSIPVWIPLVTILGIAAAQVIVAVLAVFPLIGMPPAKLAAKYDF